MARPKKETAAKVDAAEEKPVQDTAFEEQEVDSGAKTEEDKLTLTRSELNDLIASAVASAMADSKPQVVQVAPVEDPVVLLFLGGIMAGSTVALGELGNIYRDGGTLTVSKRDFFSKLNGTAEGMLRQRKLIVVSGLTDEERERYNVLYRENELLTEKTYGRLLLYPIDELATVYTALCPEHRAIAAKIFRTALEDGDGRVTEAKMKRLAKIDRESGVQNSPFKTMLGMVQTDEDD